MMTKEEQFITNAYFAKLIYFMQQEMFELKRKDNWFNRIFRRKHLRLLANELQVKYQSVEKVEFDYKDVDKNITSNLFSVAAEVKEALSTRHKHLIE